MSEQKHNESYSHILKYTSLFGGIQGLGILIGVLRNKVVAVLLGPDGVGLQSLFNATVKLMNDSTNLGVSMSGVREVSAAYEDSSDEKQKALRYKICLIRSWSLLVAVIGTFLTILLSPMFNHSAFDWGNHLLHFVCLAPVVGITAIIGGELAVLKGLRRLRELAVASVYTVLASLILSVPLFYIWRERAIVPVMVLASLAQMILVGSRSFRLFPYRVSLSKAIFRDGMNMVRLGVAFVFAGILGSGADYIIRTWLGRVGGLDILGLYNAGYMMTMVYAGMVFSAMETDYFPRLSALKTLGQELNDKVNKQIEVSLLLVSPMLVAFVIGMPIFLPLLYSGRFMPVLGMTQVAALAMYLRAMKLPVAYIPLARGDSRTYLLMEGIYDVVMVGVVIGLYHVLGLFGTGLAMLVMAVFDFLMQIVYMRYRYGYMISREVVSYALIQLPLGITAYGVTYYLEGGAYWFFGCCLFVASTFVSLAVIRQKTRLWQSLKEKIKSRL